MQVMMPRGHAPLTTELPYPTHSPALSSFALSHPTHLPLHRILPGRHPTAPNRLPPHLLQQPPHCRIQSHQPLP